MDSQTASFADLHQTASGESSFFEPIAEGIGKGLPLAIGSGLVSMYNTAVSLGNAFGADAEKIDYGAAVANYDDDLAAYYEDHKGLVDLGGFIATSFVPGVAGIKALKMLQGGVAGTNAARSTGLLKNTNQVFGFFRNAEQKFTGKALNKIRNTTNEVYDSLANEKLLGIAAGVGEQALQGVAFETAVLLSMNQSPVLSAEDEGYFTSLLRNSHEILTAGAITGVVGGTVSGLVLSGKLNKAIREVDIQQLPSKKATYLGVQQMAGEDPGSAIAMDFAYWVGRKAEFEARKGKGELSDPEIIHYERSSKRQADDIRLRITQKITNGDGRLGEELWKSVTSAPNPVEAMDLSLSAARLVETVTLADEPLGAALPKVFTSAGELPFRQAKNILARQKVFEGVIDNPTAEDFIMLERGGYELYRSSDNVYHVVEESRYAKQTLVKEQKEFKTPELIVKLSGDQAGQITEYAFPTIGDLGEVSIHPKTGQLLLNKLEWDMPKTFNPLENKPIDSNAQFVWAAKRNLDDLAQVSGAGKELDIPKGDLPLLERLAVKNDFKGELFYDGSSIDATDIVQVLREEKLVLRQELMQAGHDFKQIARELNVTEEFAETGMGDGFLLSKIEDHTVPQYAKIFYDTNRVPDKYYARGVEDLRSRVALGKDMNLKAAAKVLGPMFAQMPKTNGTMLDLSTIPGHAGFLTRSDYDYGGFGAVMQNVGRIVNTLRRERSQGVFQSLQGLENQIAQLDKVGWADANLVLSRGRSAKEPLYLLSADITGQENIFIEKPFFKQIQKLLEKNKDDEAQALLEKALKDNRAFTIKNKDVEAYFLANHEINQKRVANWNAIFAAKGSGKFYDPDQVYFPPLDTRRYPFVAFVKEKAEVGTGDLQEVGVIAAPTAKDLEAKINQVESAFGKRFDTYSSLKLFTADDIKAYKKIQAEYESGPLLGESLTDQAMRKEGLLYEFQPRTDLEFIKDFQSWHWNQETAIIRQGVELHYAQEFAELRAMAQNYDNFATSKFGAKQKLKTSKENPYTRYIHTGLDISDFDRYDSLWGKFNDVTQGFFTKAFSAWDTAVEKASAGEMDWIAANKLAESYGLRMPYKDVVWEVVNPRIENARSLEGIVAKVNGSVSTLTLGLDFLNSVINVISFPIMGLAETRNILQHIKDPAIVGRLADATGVEILGLEGTKMPTSMKLLSGSIERFFKDDGTLLKYYTDIGAVQDSLQLYKNVASASSLTEEATSSAVGFREWADKLHAAARLGKTITGHEKAEQFVRFLAADIMKQITEIAHVPKDLVPTYINSFVSRVHGNYLANQRPHLFQGPVGQAISLFQTYQFNIMQNMVRYVGQGDKTAAAMLLGLQNTIFGLQANPGFYILNAAIGSMNPEHQDIVSATRGFLNTEVIDPVDGKPVRMTNIANWVLYGLGSNVLQTSLYNRGDLTPRYVTVVPTQLSDVPGIAIPVKAISAFYQTASNIVKGGNMQQSLLDGLAHFGANRPLSGLAQLAQGYRTTGSGNLISAYSDLDGWTVAAKLAGGEELNRAVALDAYYRNLAYKKKDQDTINQLGEAVKTTMYKGQSPTEEQVTSFMNQYTRAGGSPHGFNRWMQNKFKNANESQINRLKAHVSSRAGRLQAQAMGAEEVPDFWNQEPSIETE